MPYKSVKRTEERELNNVIQFNAQLSLCKIIAGDKPF